MRHFSSLRSLARTLCGGIDLSDIHKSVNGRKKVELAALIRAEELLEIPALQELITKRVKKANLTEIENCGKFGIINYILSQLKFESQYTALFAEYFDSLDLEKKDDLLMNTAVYLFLSDEQQRRALDELAGSENLLKYLENPRVPTREYARKFRGVKRHALPDMTFKFLDQHTFWYVERVMFITVEVLDKCEWRIVGEMLKTRDYDQLIKEGLRGIYKRIITEKILATDRVGDFRECWPIIASTSNAARIIENARFVAECAFQGPRLSPNNLILFLKNIIGGNISAGNITARGIYKQMLAREWREKAFFITAAVLLEQGADRVIYASFMRGGTATLIFGDDFRFERVGLHKVRVTHSSALPDFVGYEYWAE